MIIPALLGTDRGAMRVPERTGHTPLSRPAVSRHLRVLKDTGLISVYRAGTRDCCCVDPGDGCWEGLRALSHRIADTVAQARAAGYPGGEREDE